MRERRRIVTEVQAAWGVSERSAARFTGFARSSLRYRTVRDPTPELRARIRELAAERPRWGYRRIHVMLGREGWAVNRKRVLRLYREEGLLVRRKGKRRRSQAPRPVRDPLGEPNQRWSIDFVHDALASGRRFRCLTVLDEFTRESLAIEVDYSLPASRVIEVLDGCGRTEGSPGSSSVTTVRSSRAERSTPGPTLGVCSCCSLSRAVPSKIASSRASTAHSETSA